MLVENLDWRLGKRRWAHQLPLLNSLALRLALRSERRVADTAALKAAMVARRDVKCMVVDVSVVILGDDCVLTW